MVLRRKDVFNRQQVGVYHVTTRCVRQAFLLGDDYQTGHSNHQRKRWIEEWFQSLTDVMLIEICAYAVMDNHTHSILRNRPDLLENMDDVEIAKRLVRLYPGFQCLQALPEEADAERVRELLSDLDELHRRKYLLTDISIFMARWEEAVARRANKVEDKKGRFWEGRFHCQKLLDTASILAATIYVELNPLRANIVELPEYSQYTSLVKRLKLVHLASGHSMEHLMDSDKLEEQAILKEDVENQSSPKLVTNVLVCEQFLPFGRHKYLKVLDYVSRRKRLGKSSTTATAEKLLVRLGVEPDRWRKTASTFEESYRLFAGSPELLSQTAVEKKKRCLHGMRTARYVYHPN